jgi:hypothetical protein
MMIDIAVHAVTRARALLPHDARSLLLASLRSRVPEQRRQAIEACLAARAFAAGFARGADPVRTRRRHIVDMDHEHWLRGYEAGQHAADHAAAQYLGDQLRPPGGALGSSAAPPCTPRPAAAPLTLRRAQPTPQLTLF